MAQSRLQNRRFLGYHSNHLIESLFASVIPRKIAVICLIGSFISDHAYASDVWFNGFASIVMGRTYADRNDTLLVDYPAGGSYESKSTMQTETLAGLQMLSIINEDLNATVQVVGRGTEEFNASIEWAYFTYEMTPEWKIQGGRKRLPLYFYSDFFDLGYAYHWIRPPQDNYTWQIFNYNGINVIYNTNIPDDWVLQINAYYGREDSPENPFNMRSLRPPASRFYQSGENWKDIFGTVINASKGPVEFRINHMSAEREITEKALDHEKKDAANHIQFYGASLNYDDGSLIVLSELNLYQEFYDTTTGDHIYWETWLISLGYRINDFIPHVTHSVFDSEDGQERHETLSLGLRWDFHPSVAFKIQGDKTRDYGNGSFSSNTDLISFGFDAVF